MKRYLIIVEPCLTGFSAYSPDVDGCVATGKTATEAQQNFQDALEFHLEGLKLEGLPCPEPKTLAVYAELAA